MQNHFITEYGSNQPTKIPKDLLDAYCTTLFRVDAPEGPFVLRVGSYSPEVGAWLCETEWPGAVFVTAENPQSLVRDPIINQQAHARLVSWAEHQKAPFVEGDPEWENLTFTSAKSA